MSQCTFWCSVLSDLDGLSEGQRATIGLNAPSGAQCFPTYKRSLKKYPHGQSQCTFWCSVLSDALTTSRSITTACRSQCTFWCSVLSDALRTDTVSRSPDRLSLNAPSGAQCFPTPNNKRERRAQTSVSMHLLVLSAFRLGIGRRLGSRHSRVSMHLLVLSAFRRVHGSGDRSPRHDESQCTFWCSVLSDKIPQASNMSGVPVSMHLLVLSAFRPDGSGMWEAWACMSQCTFWCSVLSDSATNGRPWVWRVFCLNAPSGAQCFPT